MAKHVLVVDDDPSILETIEGVLDLEGYDVTLAQNGNEAIQRVNTEPPALIILDLMMPLMDGYAVAAELERQGWRPGIPIIVITADGRAQMKAAQVHAEGYLAKPFDIDDLIDEVARVIGP